MKIHACGSSQVTESQCSASIYVVIAQLLAVILLGSMLACSGGGSQSTSNNPSLVSLKVTPANPSVVVGNSQQFAATGTYSDNTTKDVTSTATWSSSSASVATVSTSGMVTTLTKGTATITAASGSVNGSASLVVSPPVPLQISALSETTANPFDSLTISGTAFNEGTVAISVMFIPENGDPSVMIPVSASSSTSIQAMVPPFVGASGTFTAETVDVQVVEFSGVTTFLSNRITGLQVNTLPAVPVYIPVGAMTSALLTSSLNISGSAQAAQSGDANFANTAAALAQLSADLAPLVNAVDTITISPTQTVTLTTANGATTPLTAQMVAMSDQLAQAMIAAIVSQGSIPAATSTSGCPIATGNTTYDNNLCSLQTYFQTLASQVPAARAAQRSKHAKANKFAHAKVSRAALTPPDKAVLTVYANLLAFGIGEAIFPAGGGPIASLIVAPIVTNITVSLAVNQETPPGEDIAQGVGLNFLDNALFAGTPILGTAVDEIVALKTILTWSPPRSGILLSSGAAGFVPGGVTFVDPNSNAPATLVKVPDQTQGGSFDSTTLVVPPQTTTYSLTLSTAGTGSGSISSFPSGASMPSGMVVALTAAPAAGSTFAGWSGGGCSGTAPSCSVTMSKNQAVTATFTQTPQQQIGVGGANVSYSGGSVSCTNTGGFFDNCSGSITLNIGVAIQNGEVAVQMDQLTFVGANPYSAGTVPGQIVIALSGGVAQGACPAGVMNTDIEVIDGYASTTFVTIGNASSVPLTVNCGPGT